MAVKTWSRTVGDANWSTAANWSGGTVPVNNDSVEFDATSVLDCTVDALGTFNDNIAINAGYTGIITQAINISVGTFGIADGTWTKTTQTFTTGALTISGGVFNGGSGAITTTGTWTFSGGNVTATSGLWTISAGSLTQTNTPTFSANGGTITFTGGTATVLTAPNLTLNIIDFNKTNVNFTVAAGTTCPFGTAPSCDAGSGTLIVNGTVTWTNTFTLDSSISVASTGTVTVSGTQALSVGGSLTFDPAATITANIALTIAGTLTATITATAYTFPSPVVISKSGGNLTIAANTTIPLGANPTSAFSLHFTVNGTVTVSGAWTMTSGNGTDFTVGATGTISGALTSIDVGSYSVIINSAATFPTGVELLFTDGTTSSLTATGGRTFAASTISKSIGGFTLAASTLLTVTTGSFANAWTIDGTLTGPDGGSLTSAGGVTVNATGTIVTSGTCTFTIDGTGSFNASSTVTGTWNFIANFGAAGRTFAGGGKTFGSYTRTGSGAGTQTITGTNTFTGTFTDALGLAAHTITFPNVTTTVGGFFIRGSAGKLVTLQRTGAAGTFAITTTSTDFISCNYISVSNSTVDASPIFYAGADSTDGTGNTNWIFTNPPQAKTIAIM